MEKIHFFGTTPSELVELLDQRQQKKLDEFLKHFEPQQPNKYVRRKNIAQMYDVNLSTIHNWTVRGILTAYQIGGVVMYKLSEVEDAIVKLKK